MNSSFARPVDRRFAVGDRHAALLAIAGDRDARRPGPVAGRRRTEGQGHDPQPLPRRGPVPRHSGGTELQRADGRGRDRSSTRSTQNNFPVRAKGLAKEILKKQPDLVGLQEAALWRTAPCDDPRSSRRRPPRCATTTSSLLLNQLNKHGQLPRSWSASRNSTSSRRPIQIDSPDSQLRHQRAADDARRDPRPRVGTDVRPRVIRARVTSTPCSQGGRFGRPRGRDPGLDQRRRQGRRQPLVPVRRHTPRGVRQPAVEPHQPGHGRR